MARRLTRRAWRRIVAEEIVERLDAEGELFLTGYGIEDRREMLRVAALLPDDVVAELYEDPYFPGYTFMELQLLPAPGMHATEAADPWETDQRAAGG